MKYCPITTTQRITSYSHLIIENIKEKLEIKDELINEGVLITENILEKDLLKIIGEDIKFIRIEEL